MKFDREIRKERVLRGAKILPEKKLEGFRLLNELADRVLTSRQKAIRRKLREGGLF